MAVCGTSSDCLNVSLSLRFYTPVAQNRYDAEIATQNAFAALRRPDVRTPSTDTASNSAPISAAASVSAPVVAPKSTGTSKPRNFNVRREKKVAAVAHAVKKATLSKTFEAIKRTGLAIVNGVRYVLGAMFIMLISTVAVEGKVAANARMSDKSGMATRSGKENPRRATGN